MLIPRAHVEIDSLHTLLVAAVITGGCQLPAQM